jgi:hypothetical protein
MKSILDPTFRYTPSVGTDIRKTFARIRREQRAAAASEAAAGNRKCVDEGKGADDVSRNVLAMTPRRQAISLGSR